MATPLALVFDLIAHDNASAAFTKVGASAGAAAKETSSLGSAFAKAGGVIALAGVAVAAVSVKMAADFQEATTQLVTGAGESEKNIKLIRDGLISMAPAVGIGPTALAKAMFLVESAGYHGADGLKVMKAAAEGAKVGGAEATVVANALTTAMTDYRLPTSQAADVTSKLVATVAAGKTNMTELAGSLSAVLPSAAAAKVSLSQVLGAMGTMTSQGISAQQAAQNLANTIRSLSNPSAVASKAMAQIGLNSTTVAKELGKKGLTGTMDEIVTAITKNMGPAGLVLQSSFNESKLAAQSAQTMLKGLPPSLQGLAKEYLAGTVTAKEWTKELKSQPALTANLGKQFATTAKQAFGFSDTLKSGGGAAKTFNAVLSDVTGGSTGLNTALALTGGNMATFKTNTENISKATSEAGGHVKGWAETQKDLKTQLAQAQAGVQAMGVKIGMVLIPVVQSAINLGVKWSDWMSKHAAVTRVLAEIVGGLMVTALTAWIASMIRAGVTSTVTAAQAARAWAVSSAETLAIWAMYAAGAISSAASSAAAWVAASARTVASLAVTAAGFVAQGATMVASMAVTVARTVAGWVLMGAQSLLAAAKIALSWIIAMGPIAIVIAAVIGLGVLIYKNMDNIKGWIGTAWNWVKTTTSSVWGAIVSFFQGIPAKVSAAIDDVITFVKKVFSYTPMGIIITNFGAIVAFVKGVPGKILGALGNLGSLLLSAGGDLLRGLANGISGAIGGVINAAKNAASAAVSAVKGALGIKSPSSVFAELGRHTVQGFIGGIDGQRGALSASMASMVKLPTVGSLDFASSAVRSNAVGGSGTGGSDLLAEVQGLRADIRALPKTYQMGQRQGAR